MGADSHVTIYLHVPTSTLALPRLLPLLLRASQQVTPDLHHTAQHSMAQHSMWEMWMWMCEHCDSVRSLWQEVMLCGSRAAADLVCKCYAQS